jgi:hypothetical protein
MLRNVVAALKTPQMQQQQQHSSLSQIKLAQNRRKDLLFRRTIWVANPKSESWDGFNEIFTYIFCMKIAIKLALMIPTLTYIC